MNSLYIQPCDCYCLPYNTLQKLTNLTEIKFTCGKCVNKLSKLSKTIQFSLLICLCSFAHGDEIEVIKVTAQNSVSQAPLSVMDDRIMPQEQLMPVSSISALLRTLPSIGFSGQGGEFQVISIRGSSRWRVLTRFNQAVIHTDRRAGVSNSFIDSDFISHIYVRKGGTATQFGSGALSGVVSLQAAKYQQSWLSVSAETNGDFRKTSTGIAVAGWSFGASFAERNSGSDAHRLPLNNEYQRRSFYANKNWQITPDWDATFTLLVSNGDDIGKTNNDEFLTTKDTRYPKDNHSLLQFSASSDDSLTTGLSYHKQQTNTRVTRFSSRINSVANQSDDIFFYIRKDWSLNNQNTISVNYEWDARFNVDTKEDVLFIGASADNSLETRQALNGEQHTHSLVFTWQKQWKNLVALAGVRTNIIVQKNAQHSAIETTETDQFSTGYINFSYQLLPELTFISSIGSSFRFPTLSERFFAGTTGRGELIGSQDLHPEKSFNTEFGFKYINKEQLFRAAIYHNNVDNFVERVSINDEVQQFKNRDSGEVYGVEAQWKVSINPHWHYHVTADWQHGTLDRQTPDQNVYLADIAPVSVRSTLSYQKKQLSAELQHQYRHAFTQPASGETVLPSASTFSIAVNWQITDATRISVWGNNLTNKYFQTTTDDKSAASMGRSIGLQLHWVLD